MKSITLVVVAALAFVLSGVEAEEKGFRLPGGDAESGRESFIRLRCHECHLLPGAAAGESGEATGGISLALARDVRFVRRYEDLIIAITNPRHVVAEQYQEFLSQAEIRGEIESYMPDLTREMTVKQLLDLVAFLDEVYRDHLPGYGAPEEAE